MKQLTSGAETMNRNGGGIKVFIIKCQMLLKSVESYNANLDVQ